MRDQDELFCNILFRKQCQLGISTKNQCKTGDNKDTKDISDESAINSTSHLADKYTDATSGELSSQFVLLVVEVREVDDNSLYLVGLSVVGRLWRL